MHPSLASLSAARTAVHEARALHGEPDFAQALRFIPDEFHVRYALDEDRFVASAARNAEALGRSAYTVALYALDIA